MGRTSSALIIIVLALLSLGIVMLASTSSVRGAATFNDPEYFLKRQLVWLVIGVGLCIGAAKFDYHWWQKISVPLVCLALLLLVLVFCPWIGVEVNGSHRWLRAGSLTFQASEFAKFAVIVGLARWMSRVGARAKLFVPGLFLPALWLCVFLGLLILEPDYGTTMLVAVVAAIIMFAGGTHPGQLILAGAGGMSLFLVAIMQNEVRMRRILAFLWPERYPDAAHQLAQSKIAFILGGIFGSGLGNSMQKQFYLPEAHTDFILAIIGEELGLIATLSVALLFVGILICGMITAFHAPDSFGRLLAFGITVMLVAQAAINIGVVTGCLPTKGLPLPFISYGGSSLMMALGLTGVLLNIGSHAAARAPDDHTQIIKDRTHRL